MRSIHPTGTAQRIWAVAAVPALLLLGASACFNTEDGPQQSCSQNEQCPEVCSRGGECIAASDAIEIRASWTIGGQAPSPAAPGPCGNIDAFEVSLESDGARDIPLVYYPVPCDLGQVYYDRMSSKVQTLRMSAAAADGSILEVLFADIEGPSANVQLNFNPL